MSSAYHILCMSHEPAIVIDGDWSKPADAIAALQARDGIVRAHANCDLLVGRYSYPLIEVCCPGCNRWGTHSNEKWVDAAWLRLLYAAYRAEVPAMQQLVVKEFSRGCWGVERVHRLRVELGIEPEDGGQ